MRELSLTEIQKIELSMLVYFDEYCRQNKLRYGLTSGTVLGAVRHGGFIPWDDDIDLVMPRPDYEKFISLYENERDKKYELANPYKDNEYIYEYIKLMDLNTHMIEDTNGLKIPLHVYIDIFPVDGLPASKQKQLKIIKKCKRRQKVYAVLKRAKYKVNTIKGMERNIWLILKWINDFLPQNFLIQWLDKAQRTYSYDSSSYAGVLTGQGLREVLHISDYQLNGIVEFENKQFHTYDYPEKYLTQFFGDYMTLPSEEQRKGHDNYVWVD